MSILPDGVNLEALGIYLFLELIFNGSLPVLAFATNNKCNLSVMMLFYLAF